MAECTGLENQRTARYREFESPSLRLAGFQRNQDSRQTDVSPFLLRILNPTTFVQHLRVQAAEFPMTAGQPTSNSVFFNGGWP